MPLVSNDMDGWRLNRINAGAPYHVEAVTYGPQYGPRLHGKQGFPQVCDARGVVAISRNGAVFCESIEQASQLCEMANSGQLDTE